MNIWANSVITNKGLSLQAKLIEGSTLSITRAVTGAGYVTPGLLQQQTAVTDEKQTLTFNPITYPTPGKCALPCFLKNDDLETGYTAMQIGIYALDPDEGEILYFITQAESETGTIVPAADEVPGYSAEWTFYFQYGMADSVNITVNQSNTATIEMLENKADIDLTNVTNIDFYNKAIEAGVSGLAVVTTEGTSTAYTAELKGVTELYSGLAFIMIPHVTSSTTRPTLNVNGLGAKNIRQPLSINNAAAVEGALPTWLSVGKPILMKYDGTQWKVDFTRSSGSNMYGTVAIENGGTGAETAEAACNNLGAARLEYVDQILGDLESVLAAL